MSENQSISYETIRCILPRLPPASTKWIVKPSNASERLYEAKHLLEFISIQRAKDKETWSTKSLDGLDVWVEFSKRGSVFTQDDCSKLWTTFRTTKESILTLINYIKEENIESYTMYKKEYGKNVLLRSIASNGYELFEEDVAGFMYIVYKDEFLYYNASWYQFKERWVRIKDCIELRSHIPIFIVCINEEIKTKRSELEMIEKEVRDMEEEEDDTEEQKERVSVLRKRVSDLDKTRTKLIHMRTQIKIQDSRTVS